MKILRLILRVSLALAALIVVAIVGLWFYLPPMCANDLIKAIPSPDGKKKVVVFQRDCGATTGFSTQAALLSSSEALSNKSGNVFASDTNHGAAPSGQGGGPELQVAWRNANTVAISYHPAVRVFKAEPEVAGVRFTYSAVENAAQPSTPAAGLPQRSGGRPAAEFGR